MMCITCLLYTSDAADDLLCVTLSMISKDTNLSRDGEVTLLSTCCDAGSKAFHPSFDDD